MEEAQGTGSVRRAKDCKFPLSPERGLGKGSRGSLGPKTMEMLFIHSEVRADIHCCWDGVGELDHSEEELGCKEEAAEGNRV